ncbi:unnamed protein product [Sphagnum balticum]
MSIISIRPNGPRPLCSRKRHHESAGQLAHAAPFVNDLPGFEAVAPNLANASASSQESSAECSKELSKGVRLLIPVAIFAAIYLYGMFDQAPSNALTNFESNLFVFLAPAILLSVGLINVYGVWKSRRITAHKAKHS